MIFRFLRSASSISSSACRDVRRKRLLDEHVLAVFEGRLRELVVRPDRRDDRDRVDVRRAQDFGEVGGERGGSETPCARA